MTLFVVACARLPAGWVPETPYPPSPPPAVGDILHVPTGTYVSEEQLVAAATDARLVYLGETHDNVAAHRLQVKVLRALAERWPGQVALGMEMFTPTQQGALDAWVAGMLSEKEFLKRSRWHEVWRMDFAYYRELLVLARDERIPVIGLNADQDLVRAVGTTELAALDAEDRQRLPDMDFGDPYHQALTRAIYGGHVKGESGLAGFLRVQTLWDESMATNVARYLGAPENRARRMMVIAGGNHIRFGIGIPRRVYRRLPASYVTIGIEELVVPDGHQDRLMDVDLPSFPMPPFEYLVFTAFQDLDKEKVTLGVLLEEDDGRVVVRRVVPGSAAAAAGLVAGDVLLRMDGTPLEETFDVVYAVQQKAPGDRAWLEVTRDGAALTLEVEFLSSSAASGHSSPP